MTAHPRLRPVLELRRARSHGRRVVAVAVAMSRATSTSARAAGGGTAVAEEVEHGVVGGVLREGVDGGTLAAGDGEAAGGGGAAHVGLVERLHDEGHPLRLLVLRRAVPQDRDRARDRRLRVRVVEQRRELVAQDDERRREDEVALGPLVSLCYILFSSILFFLVMWKGVRRGP